MAKTDKLTKKESDFVKHLVSNGGNGTKAAMKAYNAKNPKSASVLATKALNKPKVQSALEKELAKQNITLSRALKPISMALANDDIEIQLKGSDRALKLLLPDQRGDNTLNFNLNIDSANFGAEFVVDAEEVE